MRHTIVLPRDAKTKEAIIKLPDTYKDILTVNIQGMLDDVFNKEELKLTLSFGDLGTHLVKVQYWEDVKGLDPVSGENVHYKIAYVSADCVNYIVSRGLLVVFSENGKPHVDFGVYKAAYLTDETAANQAGFDHLFVIKC